MTFNYQINYSDPTNAVGAEAKQFLLRDLGLALDEYSKAIFGKGTLIVQLTIQANGGANGGSPYADIVKNINGIDVSELNSNYELRTGQHYPGYPYDIAINLDPIYPNSIMDPSPTFSLTGPIQPGKSDPTGVFLHELGHGFGFISSYSYDGTPSLGPGSAFASLEVKDAAGHFYFIGPHAEAVYGGPVPLTDNTPVYNATHDHLGNTLTDRNLPFAATVDPLSRDVMSGVASWRGVHYTISPLDWAVLKDTGISVDSQSLLPANLNSAQTANLVELYVASFNRAPDATGLFYWANQFSNGMSLQTIAKNFFLSPEATAAYPATQALSVFVTTVYNNVLNRAPDTAGLNYWVSLLQNGQLTRDTFLLNVINGANSATGGSVDALTLANKEAVGFHFAVDQALNDGVQAKTVMNLVDSTAASVTTANALTDSYHVPIVGISS